MATRSIGSLGTQKDPVDLNFEYFGLVVRVHPDVSDLELVEFMMAAADIDETDEVKGMVALSRYLHGLVHPEDWDGFWRAAKGNRQTLTDLMGTAQAIISAVSGFPTGQPSDSAPGRPSTRRKSKAASSSQPRRPRQDSDTGRALQLLEGRPDLKVIVADAYEAREAAG